MGSGGVLEDAELLHPGDESGPLQSEAACRARRPAHDVVALLQNPEDMCAVDVGKTRLETAMIDSKSVSVNTGEIGGRPQDSSG